MKMKKAAMFGLDARIALAIFGALSVISGAALYSAIQDAKVTSVITDMREVTKAVEQFYLDTGELLSLSPQTPNYDLESTDLTTDPGLDGWSGPYLSLPEDPTANSYAFLYPRLGSTAKMFISYRRSDADWGSFTLTDMGCYKTTASCSIVVGMRNGGLDLYKAIENEIDGTANPGDDNFAGKITYNATFLHWSVDVPFPPALSSNS